MSDSLLTVSYQRFTRCAVLWAALFLAALFACTFIVPSARAQELPNAQELPDAEELIFEVTYPPYLVSPGVFAYQKEGRYYLPLIELAQQYDFFVDPEIDRGYVSGWAVTEDNSFSIDLERGELVIRGERSKLPADAVLPFDEVATSDFYVQMDLLSQIWPVHFSVDLSRLVVISEPDDNTKLPFEERIERRKRQEVVTGRREAQEKKKKLKFIDNFYKLIGKPVLDLQTNYKYDLPERQLTGTNTVSGAQQLGFAYAQYGGTYTYDEHGHIRPPDNFRFKLERKAVGEDTMPLGIKQADAGDTTVRFRDLVGSGVSGRGATISTYANDRDTEFDKITVEGTGPAGWDLELYNNDVLIDFGKIDDFGDYKFEDVILTYGNNVVRVVMYGPQGQVKEAVHNYSFSGTMLPPGEWRYSAGVVDAGKPLIPLNDTAGANSPDGLGASGQVAYGVNNNFTAFASLSQLPVSGASLGLGPDESVEKRYITAGAILTGYGMSGQIEGYQETGGGNALDLRLSTRLAGINLNLQGSFFNQFESPDSGYGNNAKSLEVNGQASTTMPTPLGALGLRVNVKHTERLDNSVTTDIDTQQSIGKGGLRVSHSTTTSLRDQNHEKSTGRVDTSYNWPNWQFRGTLNYNMYPKADLDSVQTELRYKPSDTSFQAALSLNHNFMTMLSTVGVQLGYDFDSMLGTVSATYQEQKGWVFALQTSTSLNPYTPDGSYVMESKSKAKSAPVIGRAFLDYDNNGVFSEGDEYLEGVALKVNGRRSDMKSGDDGVIIADRGGAYTEADVEIDQASLGDPYYVPSVKGYRTKLLPGTVPQFDFPIVETGSVDGTVYRDDDGKPVQGMRLELVDAEGDVAMTTETAYDGFYIFEYVLPGTYTVRADPTYKVNVPPATVTVASEELYASGIDLLLLGQAAEAEAAANQDGESGGVAQMHHAPAANGTLQPAPLPSDERHAGVIVKDLRLGENPDKGRLVLDLSGPAKYNITVTDGGSSVVIDIPDAAWGARSASGTIDAAVVRGYDTEALDDGSIRIQIYAKTKMSVADQGMLEPDEDGGYRLYFDFAEQK